MTTESEGEGMSEEKLIQTVAALARNERPPCPWCGAEYAGTSNPYVDYGDEFPNEIHINWKCGSNSQMRACACYEVEIATLREENARLREELNNVEHDLAAALGEIQRVGRAKGYDG